MSFRREGLRMHPLLVNGAAAIMSTRDDEPFSLVAFTIADGRVVEIDIVADPARLRRLDLAVLGDSGGDAG